MGLSKAIATKIMEVVAADTKCRAAINDPIYGNYIFERMKIAGATRNLSMILCGLDREDPTFQEKICVGIALVTAEAISTAGAAQAQILKTTPRLPEVRHANTISRVHWEIYHTATEVRMIDGTSYVFDWHETLNVFTPVIYQREDWLEAKNGIHLDQFSGFAGAAPAPAAGVSPPPGPPPS